MGRLALQSIQSLSLLHREYLCYALLLTGNSIVYVYFLTNFKPPNFTRNTFQNMYICYALDSCVSSVASGEEVWGKTSYLSEGGLASSAVVAVVVVVVAVVVVVVVVQRPTEHVNVPRKGGFRKKTHGFRKV
eukprot:1845086-Amphidinium_carterae.1